MKRVFICSPFAGDIKKNKKRARTMMEFALRAGHAPIAPHLLYPQVLSESAEERAMGLQAGLCWLSSCDELWMPRGVKVSIGMAQEIVEADRLSLPIREVEV